MLQDNGGDDLTVSANGPFTFATKLAGGAAYNVTVKTNPSGQSCSVANGSGTIAAADVTNVAVTCSTTTGSAGSDDFNRPDGSLGSSWVAISDGALSISSQAVVGTSATAGDIRIAETYSSDQSSQIQLTSTQLSGGQWVGPTVRTQNGGQDTYLGIYFWNGGSPELRLYKRNAGTWIQLGSSYNSGPLPAGTTLQLNAVGSTISFLQDGVTRITATDTSVSGGAPGIMTYGQAKADNWAGAGATGSSSPTYSVGGSVSGLSGTVVLQDNGGDDLTVTANGPFTFATKLAGGAAYNVTVKTNPSGQSCSVANGSGTIAAADVTNVAVSCSRHRLRGQRRLQSPRRLARVELGRNQRRGAFDRLAGGRRHDATTAATILTLSANGLLRLRDQAGRRRRLQRHRQDEPERPELQRRERHRHDRRRRRHERRRHLRRHRLRGQRRLSIAPTARWVAAWSCGAATARFSIASQAVVGTGATAGAPSAPRRRTAATSPPRSSSPRRSSRAGSGSAPPCAPRTAARTPTSGSTSGTAAVQSSASTSGTRAPGFSSAAPTTRGRCPPARRCS